MRRRLVVVALLIVPLALGVAAAQEPLPPAVTVTVEPFEAPVQPLAEAVTTQLVVSIDCRILADPPQQGVPVPLVVEGAPSWAVVTTSPATITFPASCPPGTRVEESATLIATASEAAPAFAPANFTVRATVATPAGSESGVGGVGLEVDYLAVLDAKVSEPIRVGAPGVETVFDVEVANFGNGDTRLEFVVDDVTEGWSARVPDPVVLGSTQAGTEPARTTVALGLTPADGGAFTNAPGVMHVRILGAYAHGDAAETDEAVVTMLLTSRGGAMSTAAPAGGLILALLGAASVLMARKRDRFA